MMKKRIFNSFKICLLTGLLMSIALPSFSQSFPKQGATWIFKNPLPVWMQGQGQKWEYIGDSVVTDGVIKKFNVTGKILKPAWNPTINVEESNGVAHFLYSGDAVWDLQDSLSPIADFSLQVGDSAFTPFHSSLSFSYGDFFNSSNCTYEDSLIFFQKGWVIENGVKTEDNISYRYYKLKFLDYYLDTITVKFNERSIITKRFWHYQVYNPCGTIVEGTPLYLNCYFDDFSTDSTCAALNWFETLNVKNDLSDLDIKIYPNPANKNVSIDLSESIFLQQIQILNLSGQEVFSKSIAQNQSYIYLTLSELPSGIYLLQLQSEKGVEVRKLQILK